MPIKSFIGADHYRPVLHNVRSLGRTNMLHHLLFCPNAESLERLVKSTFAKAFSHSFSSLVEAKDFFTRKLERIHPLVLAKYQTEIDGLDSLDKVKNFSRKLFNSLSNNEVKTLVVKIKNSLGKAFLDKNLVLSSVGDLWTMVIRGRCPKDICLKEYIATSLSQILPYPLSDFPEALQSDAKALQEYVTSCIEMIQTLSTDEEIKKYAMQKYDAKELDLAFLTKDREGQIQQSLQSIWQRVLVDIAERVDLSGVIAGAQEKLKIFPAAIKQLYVRDMSLSRDLSDLQSRVEGYMNDPVSVRYTSGVRCAKAGTQGHPKIIDLQRQDKLVGFMKHINGSKEMQVHRLYKFLLETCSAHLGYKPPIFVPRGTMLESFSDRVVYTDANGEQASPSRREESNYIRDLLAWISCANTKRDLSSIEKEVKFDEFIKSQPIGFFDLINSSNLSEFFQARYLSLSKEAKKKMFIHLGMVAFLDLLIGNQDRLVRLGPVGEESFFDVFSSLDGFSNLENLMVSEDSSVFHAIDNTIGDGVNSAPVSIDEEREERNSYRLFLHEMFSLSDFNEKFAQRLLQSLKQSLVDMKEMTDEDELYQLQKQGKDIPANLILQELDEDALVLHKALQEGIHTMSSYVHNVIAPIWNSSQADQIKRTLGQDLVKTFDERLNAYMTAEMYKRFVLVK